MKGLTNHDHVAEPPLVRRPSPDSTDWRSVGLFMAVGAIAAAQIGKVLVALPALQQDFDLTPVQLAWIVSALNFAGAVLAVPLAICSIWIGQRRATLLALGTIAVASVVGFSARGTAVLIAARCVEGLGVTVILAVLPVLLVQVTAPQQLRQLLAFWPAIMPAVVATMLLSSPWAIDRYGWRPVWGVMAAAAIVCFGLMGFANRRVSRHSPTRIQQGRQLRELTTSLQVGRSLGNKSIWLLTVILACYSAQFLAVVTLLPITLLEERAVSAVGSGLLIGVAFVSNAAGCVLGIFTERHRLSTSALFVGPSAVMAASSWIAYQPTADVTARVFALLILAFAGGLIAAVAMAALPAAARDSNLTLGAALLVQGINLGQLAGPPTMAAVALLATGWQQSPIAVTFIASVAGAAGIAIRYTMEE